MNENEFAGFVKVKTPVLEIPAFFNTLGLNLRKKCSIIEHFPPLTYLPY
jgi:hypothetical protein